MDQEKVWQAALAELELTISKANFTTWLKKTWINSLDPSEANIGVPNAFTKEWLEKKYHKQIVTALKHCTGSHMFKVSYEIGTKLPRGSAGSATAHVAQGNSTEPDSGAPLTYTGNNTVATLGHGSVSVENTMDGDSNLNPRYTFETFIVGPSNELAHAGCTAVAQKPGNTYNPLFIYGGVGLGKTHLMHAIGNTIKKRNPEKKVWYVTSERFTNEFIDSISNRGSNFKSRYRDVDVLIVDDIQFIAGKEQTQEEFFHTFNTLFGANKQIILSSDRPPKAIPTLEDRLRSRFEGGMIA
ncbi:MAG: chromosomal replication initiator protein DnaA, partial [bacterium]|nr:chromosomal replication initiator protein DnaA [bacterium]